MLDLTDFREAIVRPTLLHLGLHNDAAENLVVGTAVQESRLTYLRQIKGPALGLYQIEAATHQDLWNNWLIRKGELGDKVRDLLSRVPSATDQLICNLRYATAICRLIYYRRPEPLPAADDIIGLAGYWKQHYNTHLGRGTESEFALNYREAHL